MPEYTNKQIKAEFDAQPSATQITTYDGVRSTIWLNPAKVDIPPGQLPFGQGPDRSMRSLRPRQSVLPRWVHHIYAVLFHYYWLPCPLCGQMTGGHEWHDRNGLSSTLRVGPSRGKAICASCTLEGRGHSFLI